VTSSQGSDDGQPLNPEHRLLDYYSLLDDIAIITRGMNWSLRDIKRLSVRERRYWCKWVATIAENARATAK
jgi:hypothetical protein